jgi:hypothetical protein
LKYLHEESEVKVGFIHLESLTFFRLQQLLDFPCSVPLTLCHSEETFALFHFKFLFSDNISRPEAFEHSSRRQLERQTVRLWLGEIRTARRKPCLHSGTQQTIFFAQCTEFDEALFFSSFWHIDPKDSFSRSSWYLEPSSQPKGGQNTESLGKV